MEGLSHVRVYPWCVCGGLASRMSELHADDCTMRMGEIYDALEGRNLAISPKTLCRRQQVCAPDLGADLPHPVGRYVLLGQPR